MWSRTRRILADRREDGIALIPVILVSFLMMGLLVAMLRTGEHADTSSTRDGNFDVALSTAEAGVHEAIARIEASGGTYVGSFAGDTPQGGYSVGVTRANEIFEIEATGEVGSARLGRSRTVRVTLGPPRNFLYAMFSNTSIELKNLDTIHGDVWANDSVLVDQNNDIFGSVTAARSWVEMRQNSRVRGEVWSGGSNGSGWAIKLHNNAEIDGDVKASVSDPGTTCPDAGYDLVLGNGAKITGSAVTCGSAQNGGGAVGGGITPGTFTGAAVPKPLPAFSFNPNNYPADTYHSFTSVADFKTWLDTGTNKTSLEGTFYVSEASPSQTKRIDLTGAHVVGDTTIVTNAPVFTNGVTDDTSGEQTFVLVSHYAPPTGSSCSVDHDSSECAIHIKNNFSPTCKTAVLIYADNGPVAVKNNAKQCGSIVSESIMVKNNQELAYDPRIARIIGFGSHTYEITRWEELPA